MVANILPPIPPATAASRLPWRDRLGVSIMVLVVLGGIVIHGIGRRRIGARRPREGGGTRRMSGHPLPARHRVGKDRRRG